MGTTLNSNLGPKWWGKAKGWWEVHQKTKVSITRSASIENERVGDEKCITNQV